MRLKSSQDKSINFIEESLTGFLESRYVRKTKDYFICYLSSQSGCNKGCKFCHLTTTKQTKFDDALPVDYLTQASKVLKQYILTNEPANYIHYNFMARGEALANKYLLADADTLLFNLGNLAKSFDPNLSVKFNISTILPKGLDKSLDQVFKIVHPTIYYSCYSVNPDFRKKWLPQALDIDTSFRLLKEYQDFSKKRIKLHQCFIAGENDSFEDIKELVATINRYSLDVDFNLVRYNPYSFIQGKESSDLIINSNLDYLADALNGKVQIILRVGVDVFASCGTFPDANQIKVFKNATT